MANRMITETPQYQTYLEVLEVLRKNGYEIEEKPDGKGAVDSIVKRDSHQYGFVFVVEEPRVGFLWKLIGFYEARYVWTAYARHKERVKAIKETADKRAYKKLKRDFNENLHGAKEYWPDDSLIGGVMEPDENFQADGWLSILKSVIG